MEGSESEAVFDSLNLNPQRFVNEIMNTIDDLIDEAFDFYRQEASVLLKIDGTAWCKDLSSGVDSIQIMIQSLLHKRLQMWEKYCLHRCFTVPEGFSLPNSSDTEEENHIAHHALCDPGLDAQLDLLREKLSLVAKNSTELNAELRALERQSSSSDLSAGLVNEALDLYHKMSAHDMFKEMAEMASELRLRVNDLKRSRMEGLERIRTAKFQNPNNGCSIKPHSRGLSNAKLEDLQEFLAQLKKM